VNGRVAVSAYAVLKLFFEGSYCITEPDAAFVPSRRDWTDHSKACENDSEYSTYFR